MVSKSKKGRVRKARRVTPAPKKSPVQPPPQPKGRDDRTAAQIIIHNGNLVENLFKSEEWRTIAQPLLEESIASVTGRKTNGRYYHGSFTKGHADGIGVYLSGYQCGLMDLHNRLLDFIDMKNITLKRLKDEKLDEKAVMVNPFMESTDAEA